MLVIVALYLFFTLGWEQVTYSLEQTPINLAREEIQKLDSDNSYLELPEFEQQQKRNDINEKYENSLSNIDGITFMKEADYCKSNRWLTTLEVSKGEAGISRNQIIEVLNKENIESRPVWKPMHLQPYYKKCDYFTSNNEDFSAKLFKAFDMLDGFAL